MRLVAALLVAALLVGLLAGHRPATATSVETVLDGHIRAMSSSVALSEDGQLSGPNLSLLLAVGGALITVMVEDTTAIEDPDGHPIAARTLRAGDHLRISGTQAAPDRWRATRIVKLPGGE